MRHADVGEQGRRGGEQRPRRIDPDDEALTVMTLPPPREDRRQQSGRKHLHRHENRDPRGACCAIGEKSERDRSDRLTEI